MPKNIEREEWWDGLTPLPKIPDGVNIPIQEPIHHASVEWNKGKLSKIHAENIEKLNDEMWQDLRDYLLDVLKTRDFRQYQDSINA